MQFHNTVNINFIKQNINERSRALTGLPAMLFTFRPTWTIQYCVIINIVPLNILFILGGSLENRVFWVGEIF